ncbi:AaceriABR111Cp [[Ashbya] aceris (nom. inval.)]|nr:AaceriABR111Cp [[Ashbya] aceris (nom. inval.)]
MNFQEPWSAAVNADRFSASSDSRTQKVKDSLKLLKDTSDPWSQLALLTGDEESQVGRFKELLRQVEGQVNDTSKTSVPLLVYSIVFNHPEYIELLHETKKLDVNVADGLTSYSPLMWCFHLQQQECCIELLNYQDELQWEYRNSSGATALDLLVPGSEMYEFAEHHRLLDMKHSPKGKDPFGSSDDLYKAPVRVDELDRSMDDKIRLQTVGLAVADEAGISASLYQPPDTGRPDTREAAAVLFDYERLLPGQFIEFADFDIIQILDVLVELPHRRPHDTVCPAALIFQCLRYARRISQRSELVENTFHLSITRILSSQQANLGGVVTGHHGDIVSLSYWLSCLAFLYYFLYRDETFFRAHPLLLQELINAMQSLMMELCSSVHSRVEKLLVPAILSHTTIIDVKQTLYKKDWNFFKKKRQSHKKGQDSYDEILSMLYPPSVEEQMKPSPIKIVQIFGALAYVLESHQVHPLLSMQCLSTSIEWFSTSIFNIMISSKKYLSRAQAMQIRLNLSTIEDWVKNHDMTVPKSKMVDTFIWERFPYTLIKPISEINLKQRTLRNITMYAPVKNDKGIIMDTTNTLFYYQSFSHIAQIHLEPVHQLLQWLQVASSIADEASLSNAMNLLNALNPAQLLKVIEKYRYEVDEKRFDSNLKKSLANMAKNESCSILFPEKTQPLVILPMMSELTELYVTVPDAYRFVPLLPEDVREDIEMIHERNARDRSLEVQQTKQDPSVTDDETEEDDSRSISHRKSTTYEASENGNIFGMINAPSTAIQRGEWQESSTIEENPW